MRKKQRQSGFSLTEVLLAVGTLAVGLTFIGGTFLVGIYSASVSTERTIAAVAAHEAFSRIRLYGLDPSDPNLPFDIGQASWSYNRTSRFESLSHPYSPGLIDTNSDAFAYPSAPLAGEDKQYYWAAVCRRAYPGLSCRLIQVSVFVCRKIPGGSLYPGNSYRPIPVAIEVTIVPGAGNENRLRIETADQQSYINAGSLIVDGLWGRCSRVLERDPEMPDVIILDYPWPGTPAEPFIVWAVPPPMGGGRNPCIAVYQQLIRF